MKRIIYPLILMVLFGSMLRAQNPMAVASYSSSDNAYLKSLVTDLHPAIYLNESTGNSYGSGDKLVVFTDVASLDMLYSTNSDYSSVKLIQIRLHAASEETARLDLARLSAFTSLDYILFTYAYDACNDLQNDSCLPAKTTAIAGNTTNSDLAILYLLSIPQ